MVCTGTILPLGHGDYLSFQIKCAVGSTNKLSDTISNIYVLYTRVWTGYWVLEEYRKTLNPLHSPLHLLVYVPVHKIFPTLEGIGSSLHFSFISVCACFCKNSLAVKPTKPLLTS